MPSTEDLLFELEQELIKRGHPKLDAPTLKEAYTRMQNPHFQQMVSSGQVNVKMLADEIDKGVGAVKERQAKRQSPQSPASALPLGNSRVFGEQNIARTDSQIHNLPATGDDRMRFQQLMPMPLPRKKLLSEV